jgi:hypothetical protein
VIEVDPDSSVVLALGERNLRFNESAFFVLVELGACFCDDAQIGQAVVIEIAGNNSRYVAKGLQA